MTKLQIKIGVIIFLIYIFSYKTNCQILLKQNYPTTKTKYYLSPNGDDDNLGTFKQPWKTLEKANLTLRAGDTVILKKGIYKGTISPLYSGENAQKSITYLSEKPYGAILKGNGISNYIINIEERKHISIDGFIMLPKQGGFGLIDNCSYIIIKNCKMRQSHLYIGLLFKNSHYNKLIFNTFTDTQGDGVRFLNSGHNLIEGNSFSKIGHSPLNFYGLSPELTSFNVVRGNLFHNVWGRNFELFNPNRCLFEDNIFTNAFDGARSADSYSKVLAFNSIFRNNFAYDNWGGVIASGSYEAKLGGDKGYDPKLKAPDETTTLMLADSRIYNNTFANNPTFVWALGGKTRNNVDPIRSNIFKNNLFYRNGYAADFTFFKIGTGVSNDNKFITNVFFGDDSGNATMDFRNHSYTTQTLNEKFPIQFQNNMDVDPLFVDFQNRYLSLTKNSPAISSGSHLTHVVESGSGERLKVEDAR